MHSPASDVATLLADLDASLDKDRDIVRALLWQALPLAIDWRAVLLIARQMVRDGKNAVELPLRTETIAEIILAGVDGGSCQFAIEGAIPQGAGRVPLTPSAFAPFFNEAFVDEVVMHLCREQQPLMKTFAGLKNRFSKPRELAIAVEMRLKNIARKIHGVVQRFR